MNNYVIYYRVSTQKQGVSGLGLEAQKQAVTNYLRPSDRILNTFTEIESGRKDKRPKLAEAIQTAKLKNATLLIAKLDRLARSVRFISELQESKVKFVACDCPEANETMIKMLAIMAEWEAKQISERTKSALAQAKKRGVKLGNPQNLKTTETDRAKGARVAQKLADEFASSMLPVIESIIERGIKSNRGIARELNDLEFKTARNCKWTDTAVKNLMARQASTL